MATPREDEQLALSPALHWLEKAGKLRALLLRSMTVNRISFAEIERETAVDEKQAGRALTEGAGTNLPPQMLTYLLWHDRAGIILGGLADALGYEVRPKAPDLAAENRRLRAELADVKSRIESALGGMP